jgi:hypothetical protein
MAKTNFEKYGNGMLAREAFLEEHPEFDADDQLCEAFAWIYGRPRRERRRNGPRARPAGADE